MKLPQIRGRYTENADLSKTNWFRVGGAAQVLFKPADLEDLQDFLRNKPDCAVTVLGVGSNIIVRDGGIDGVVIKLGREFANVTIVQSPLRLAPSMGLPADNSQSALIVESGAAALDVNVALFTADNGIAGLEFLSGIPGTIGGAIAMNGGAYGAETKDVLIKAQALDLEGNLHEFTNEELKFTYRKCGALLNKPLIFTKAWFQGKSGKPDEIHARINEIKTAREESQPIRSRTGGSTYKNPEGHKAWQLIDRAGLRGFSIGGAQVSEKHCNFFLNTGTATAKDLEDLILHVQATVLAKTGIKLEPEIKIIGKVVSP
jgi:UDP-N-acetylmuramate dehydrogenase